MFKILDGRDCFYQWDSNRQIVIEDIDCNEVHYSNKTDKTALVCTVREENGQRIADVPNILLQQDWDITVYAFDQDYTEYSQTIKVIPRTKPDDYVYTETEVLNYNTLSERINEVEANIGQEVQDYLEENPVQAPVQSVNEKTGAVVLTAADVGAATEDYVDNAVENIELTPGPKGEPGQDGTDGLPALTYGKIKETTVTPTIDGVTNFIEAGDLPPSLFNRTPVVGDRFILLALRTTTGQTFILECEITLVTTYVASKNISVVETTGAAGAQGEKGDKGDSGGQGPQGPRGNPGFSPIATVTQTDTGATISIQDATGTTTATITNGQDGAPGADGYTPIKGTDYWTESDKAEIVQEAASSIPIATTEVAGKVKPDGTTVTITEDGTISAVGGSGGASTAADVSFDNTDTGLTATDV